MWFLPDLNANVFIIPVLSSKFRTTYAIAYKGSHYSSSSSGNISLFNPMCSGTEGNIEMCKAESWIKNHPCDSSHYAGIDCNPVDAGMCHLILAKILVFSC